MPNARPPAQQSDTTGPLSIFDHGGEVGARLRAIDWTKSLGDPQTWPQSLRSALSICLNTGFPLCLYWGPDHIMIYNEAYSPIAGDKHPWALGRRGREVWPEIWHIIGPEFEAVLGRGEAIWPEDRLLPMHRHGYTEECYFQYTLSPIRGEGDAVVGIFNAVIETTARVLSERRMSLLRELAERTAAARGAEAVCAVAAKTLQGDQADVPFCLVYLLERSPTGTLARLAGAAGLPPGHPAAPASIALSDDRSREQLWPLKGVLRTRRVEAVTDLVARFPRPLPGGRWPEPARNALVAPILATVRSEDAVGFLVIGVNSHRDLDESYRSFVDLAAAGVSAALSSARAYEEERRRAEALADLDRAKTMFFANVSHELRTPLTLMLCPIEETLSHAAQLSPADRDMLAVAHRNGLRLLNLINTLLDFSRIDEERVKPVYELLDLGELTRELAAAFHPLCLRARLALEIDCAPAGELVPMDRSMWEKIVLNLLSNAFKFTLRGRISVSLRMSPDRAQVALVVADTGLGIPEKDSQLIFERFRRAENVQGRSYEGTGLGLALVRDLARLLGGNIAVESVWEQGSRFTVSFPVLRLPGEAAAAADGGAAPQSGARARAFVEQVRHWLPTPAALDTVQHDANAAPAMAADRRPRVLLVDDNADMRGYLQHLLSAQYEVTAVADGRAALAAVEDAIAAPDLILTDVMMPQMSGVDLIRHLRAAPATRAVPIVILSARAGEDAVLRGLEAAADDYVVKPFSARELLARIRTNIEMARIRREAQAEVERRDLLRRLVDAQEQERQRIARELHDQTGQDLTGLLLGLKRIESAIASEDGRARLRELQSLTDQIGRTMHRAAWELRPRLLDDIGLLRALEAYAADWTQRCGIPIDVHAGRLGCERLAPEAETAAYRAVQEALTNVLKHAAASTVSLVLEGHGDALQIIVEDNGRGFDPEAAATCGRLGLAGIRERLALVGGTLTIESRIGRGTALYLRLPGGGPRA